MVKNINIHLCICLTEKFKQFATIHSVCCLYMQVVCMLIYICISISMYVYLNFRIYSILLSNDSNLQLVFFLFFNNKVDAASFCADFSVHIQYSALLSVLLCACWCVCVCALGYLYCLVQPQCLGHA